MLHTSPAPSERGDFAGFLEMDSTRAAHIELQCRPVTDTVTDTWTWMQHKGLPPQRIDRDVPGLPPAFEQQLLSCWVIPCGDHPAG